MTWPLRWMIRLRPNLLWLAAAVLAGLLLHIGTVLGLAHFAPNSAFAALANMGPVNQMAVLAPVTPDHQPLPFLSPTERYAVCRFDVRKGSVAVNLTLGGDDWVVAVYGARGANVFALSGADLERREVELVLSAREQGSASSPLPIARDGSTTTLVPLADRTGLVVISAPATRPAYAEATERMLRDATCTQRVRAGATAG